MQYFVHLLEECVENKKTELKTVILEKKDAEHHLDELRGKVVDSKGTFSALADTTVAALAVVKDATKVVQYGEMLRSSVATLKQCLGRSLAEGPRYG